jgi:hypothetical protein
MMSSEPRWSRPGIVGVAILTRAVVLEPNELKGLVR